MKHTFTGILVLLIAISGLVWYLVPEPSKDGRVVLMWCTGGGWVRKEQTDLFERWQLRSALRC